MRSLVCWSLALLLVAVMAEASPRVSPMLRMLQNRHLHGRLFREMLEESLAGGEDEPDVAFDDEPSSTGAQARIFNFLRRQSRAGRPRMNPLAALYRWNAHQQRYRRHN